MSFAPIVTPTREKLFIQQIEAMILSGELKPGDRLPTERELSAQMDISKTVVHAGLQELAHLGFVQPRGRSGVFVLDYAQYGNLDTLSALLQINGGALDYEMTRSIVEMRLAVEGEAARLFAVRRTEQDISELRALIDDVCRESESPGGIEHAALAKAMFRFHCLICLKSGNSIFPMLMNSFQSIGLVFWGKAIRYLGASGAIATLTKTADYLERQDGDGVVAYMKENFDQFLRMYAQQNGVPESR